jgi:hypothetical protein
MFGFIACAKCVKTKISKHDLLHIIIVITHRPTSARFRIGSIWDSLDSNQTDIEKNIIFELIN